MAINNSLNAPFPLSSTQGGLGVASPTAHAILIGAGASAVTQVALTDGQVLIGSTGNDPVAAVLTAGAGIQLTNASGAITIASTATGVAFNINANTSATMLANNGYVSTNAALTTYTLPATAVLGDEFIIVTSTSNVAFSKVIPGTTTQQIRLGNTITTLTTGSITGGSIGDVLTIVCVDATVSGSEQFQVVSSVGNTFTVA